MENAKMSKTFLEWPSHYLTGRDGTMPWGGRTLPALLRCGEEKSRLLFTSSAETASERQRQGQQDSPVLGCLMEEAHLFSGIRPSSPNLLTAVHSEVWIAWAFQRGQREEFLL